MTPDLKECHNVTRRDLGADFMSPVDRSARLAGRSFTMGLPGLARLSCNHEVDILMCLTGIWDLDKPG